MSTSLAVVIPVLNEEKDLPPSTERAVEFLAANLSAYDWRLVIADNGSTDSTPEVGKGLARAHDRVEYLRLERRGRGLALRTAWQRAAADVSAYMDVDLSTELEALPGMVRAVWDGECEIAVASRLRRGARVIGRPPLREVVSRSYSLIVRTLFWSPIRDYQCGCKVVSRRTVDDLLPLVQDNGWFFDTELLLLALHTGYGIEEVPVTWTDDPDSRVRIVSTAYGDLKGLARLRFGGLRRASRRLAGRDG